MLNDFFISFSKWNGNIFDPLTFTFLLLLLLFWLCFCSSFAISYRMWRVYHLDFECVWLMPYHFFFLLSFLSSFSIFFRFYKETNYIDDEWIETINIGIFTCVIFLVIEVKSNGWAEWHILQWIEEGKNKKP